MVSLKGSIGLLGIGFRGSYTWSYMIQERRGLRG